MCFKVCRQLWDGHKLWLWTGSEVRSIPLILLQCPELRVLSTQSLSQSPLKAAGQAWLIINRRLLKSHGKGTIHENVSVHFHSRWDPLECSQAWKEHLLCALGTGKKIQDGPKHNSEAKTKLGHKPHTQRSMIKGLCWRANNTKERQTVMKMGIVFFYVSTLRLTVKACPSFLPCYCLGTFQVFSACVQGHFLQDHDQSLLQSYPLCHGIPTFGLCPQHVHQPTPSASLGSVNCPEFI